MNDYIEIEGVRYVREDSLLSSSEKTPAVFNLEPRNSWSRFGQDIVKCPECGDSRGLHLEEVWLENAAGQKLVASSKGEDKHGRIHLSLTDGGLSNRRYTLTIAGLCEHCGAFKLHFEQHKGQTFFSSDRD